MMKWSEEGIKHDDHDFDEYHEVSGGEQMKMIYMNPIKCLKGINMMIMVKMKPTKDLNKGINMMNMIQMNPMNHLKGIILMIMIYIEPHEMSVGDTHDDNDLDDPHEGSEEGDKQYDNDLVESHEGSEGDKHDDNDVIDEVTGDYDYWHYICDGTDDR